MERHFSVFRKSSGGTTEPELIEHFKNWGWVSFLSSLAETKVFDIPGAGLDSIECVKRANAYKVFTYASEKKDSNAAQAAVYKRK